MTIKWLPLVILGGLILAIIGGVYLSGTDRGDVIKIGWVGPQTGQSAVLGMDSFVAAQIAVEELNEEGGINGKRVELIIEDDQYDTTKATSAYQKLVNTDRVKFIFANTYGSIFALAKQAERDGVLLIDPLDCNGELAGLSENVFCLATDSESIAEVLADHANSKELNKVGILYWNSDLFMPLVERIFKQNFNGQAFSEAYVAGTVDFKTQLTKMINSGIQGLVLLGYDETGIAMKQARDLGFRGQFYTTGTITSPPLQQAAQGHAEGTIFAFWDAPKTEGSAAAFTNKFIAKKERPVILDFASYPTYDAIKVWAVAANNANSTDVNKVKKELLKINNYQGVTGMISFQPDGSVRIKESAYILTNGIPILVK
jgi:branched-chain amino acid transport system substrate-binding protein